MMSVRKIFPSFFEIRDLDIYYRSWPQTPEFIRVSCSSLLLLHSAGDLLTRLTDSRDWPRSPFLLAPS